MKVLCIKDFKLSSHTMYKEGVWYDAYSILIDNNSILVWIIYLNPNILAPDYFYSIEDHFFCFEKYFISLEDYRDKILNDLI